MMMNLPELAQLKKPRRNCSSTTARKIAISDAPAVARVNDAPAGETKPDEVHAPRFAINPMRMSEMIKSWTLEVEKLKAQILAPVDAMSSSSSSAATIPVPVIISDMQVRLKNMEETLAHKYQDWKDSLKGRDLRLDHWKKRRRHLARRLSALEQNAGLEASNMDAEVSDSSDFD